jgi:DNA-directed RNA polymerase subunit RPC12/RpoP
MDIHLPIYKCNICIKEYSSYKSLWNHNNKFHNNKIESDTSMSSNVNICQPDVNQMSTESQLNDNNKIKCEICSKEFNS